MKCDCFHKNPDDPCTFSQTPWIILFGCLQLVLSQIQDIDRLSPFHSSTYAIMSKSGFAAGLVLLASNAA